MKEIKKELIRGYSVFRTTRLMDEDVKLLKKINNLIQKYNNTNKEKYRFEAINILKTTSNITVFSERLIELIRTKIIDEDKVEMFDEIIIETLIDVKI